MSQIKSKFISDNAIVAAKIATDAVTTSKIQAGAVTAAKTDSSISKPADISAAVSAEAALRVSADAATLASAESYADTGDSTTLASAESYADTGDSTTLASAESYADTGDSTTLASAESYADTGDSTTLASAESYTDTAISTEVSNRNTAIGVETSRAMTAEALLIPLSQKGANSGVATLDSGGKIPSSQIPALAITDTFVVASQAAQTALTAQVGDVAVRSDQNKTYILQTSPASSFANWVEILTPGTGITSVNGDPGPSVVLTTTEISEGSNLYFTDSRAKSAAVADALVNGVTDVAPSQNAVFDALALKSDVGHTHVAADVTDFDSAAQAATIAQVITNGVTTKAPSEDAVFDALALKANDSVVVKTVNGQSPTAGAVTITTSNITEGSNLYYTTARAKADAVENSITSGHTTIAPSGDAVFTALAGKAPTFAGNQEQITLSGTNITNQYIDLAHPIMAKTISLVPEGGLPQTPGVDFTVSLTGGSGGVTRVTFAGDLATGGNAALLASDVLDISYLF